MDCLLPLGSPSTDAQGLYQSRKGCAKLLSLPFYLTQNCTKAKKRTIPPPPLYHTMKILTCTERVDHETAVGPVVCLARYSWSPCRDTRGARTRPRCPRSPGWSRPVPARSATTNRNPCPREAPRRMCRRWNTIYILKWLSSFDCHKLVLQHRLLLTVVFFIKQQSVADPEFPRDVDDNIRFCQIFQKIWTGRGMSKISQCRSATDNVTWSVNWKCNQEVKILRDDIHFPSHFKDSTISKRWIKGIFLEIFLAIIDDLTVPDPG